MQEETDKIPVPENSKEQEWKEIVEYMEKYFGDLEKYRPNGDDWIAYYKSARGYFKHSNRLPEEKFNNFKEKDYMLWEWILKTVKGSSHAAVSGGLYFRYRSVEDFCSRSSFY